MSHIEARVSSIASYESLHIVKFAFHEYFLSMMSLDLSDEVKVGSRVQLLIKPSHVAIAKNFSGEVSYSNILDVEITSIDNGALLSSMKLKFVDTDIESIITAASSKRMGLKCGDRVQALIKASELSIGKVLND